jgi:hypothetical protein
MPETVQEPPPLIQEPPEKGTKTIILQTQKQVKQLFDSTKVLAAVGLILTATILITAAFWVWVQTLEKRVEGLEESLKVVANRVSTSSAKTPVTNSAKTPVTKSAPHLEH